MTTRKSVKSIETSATEAKGFDLSAALAAAAEAPKSSRTRASSGESDRLNVITQILDAAGPSGLAMPQIKAAYFAGKGIVPTKKEEKQVYETVFQHSDACHNKTWKESKVVFTRDESGAYSLKK